MAFLLKDLAENPALLDDLRATVPRPVCALCLEDSDVVGRITGGMCEDCRYDGLGKLVEEHPIPSAGIRRS
jgi:hypothetical protein